MWKIIGIVASMVVAGVVTFYVTLLSLGKPRSGDEMSLNAQISIEAAILACLGAGVLACHMDQRGYERARKIVGTLALMVVSGIVPLFVAGFMLLEFEGRIHGNLKGALWMGTYGLAIIGFLGSGVSAWHLHKRGTSKRRSQSL